MDAKSYMKPMPQLATEKEVMQMLHISQATMTRRNRAGVFDEARYQHGKRNLYDVQKVLEIVKYNA